ncbi:hypothetical protein A5888_000955 [Enterococcus sp. 9E7_DIV0242]|uniref:DUF4352 domain-containing protein n=2 Tax=Candidatus Enterococcus clewellii TaxID=1834193 RepID=A0A242KDC3_9ENTE|nr:hypothetical protein A5888_000966 [Enterococcus sp. 9E7_DIV0242]
MIILLAVLLVGCDNTEKGNEQEKESEIEVSGNSNSVNTQVGDVKYVVRKNEISICNISSELITLLDSDTEYFIKAEGKWIKVWINKGLLAFSSGIQSKEQIEYDLSYDLAAITPEPEIGTEMKIIFYYQKESNLDEILSFEVSYIY